jgi:N4-gp56 family major capsid protein
MGHTNTTVIPLEVGTFYNRTLLMRAVPLFVHTKWAQVKDIPRKAGSKQIKFRKYGNLSYATTPLSEGITPAGSQLSVTDITADVAQYGDFITVTDVLDYLSEDPELTIAAEILGDQAGGTLDVLTRDVMAAGTNVYYGGTGHTLRSQVAAGELITTALIDKTVRTLKNGLARKLTRMVDASTGYSTTPLNACFIGLVHPNVSYTLKGLTGFVKVENYANKSSLMEGEIGSYGEVRFIESTNAKVFTGEGASSIDVYATLIFGSDAYGISRISGEAMKNIVKPLGSAGTADPLDQRATSGWKATFVAKILNNDFLVRLETAVAA